MRTIALAIIGLVVLIPLLFLKWKRRRKARGPIAVPIPAGNDNEAVDSLAQRLSEAAVSFAAAAAALDPAHGDLKTALDSLSKQCAALAERQHSGGQLDRTARSAIIRLLLALYSVVERVTALSRYGEAGRVAPALDSARVLILKSTEALSGIAERADEAALLHLEAELDVLRERLDQPD